MTATEQRSFAELADRLGGRVGLAYLDGQGRVHSFGEFASGAAWSTIKVPLSVAALRAPTGTTAGNVRAAIRASDNGAAMALWQQLGAGARAAGAVDAVLAGHGDRGTFTQSRQVHPPYSPYGQTQWSLAAQASFAADLMCSAGDGTPEAVVLRHMGAVNSDQRWGLGRLDGALFKGGWGPGSSGRYLVRQFGIVEVNGERYAVAIASQPASGSMGGGTADLDALARWFAQSRPTGAKGLRC